MNCPSCGAQVPVEELDCTQCGASVGWCVRTRRGEEFGPYTFLQMQEMTRQGRLKPLDRVRIGLIGEWVSAPEVLSPTFQIPQQAAPSPRRSRVRARAGPHPLLLIGGAGLVLLAAATALIVTRASNPPRPVGVDDACLRNLRDLARGLQVYAGDHAGTLPSWQGWGGAAFHYVDDPGAFVCPAAPSEPGYAYNAALSGVPSAAVRRPDHCLILCDAGALGPFPGLSVYGQAPRHRGGDNLAFVDGHAVWQVRAPYTQSDIDLQP